MIYFQCSLSYLHSNIPCQRLVTRRFIFKNNGVPLRSTALAQGTGLFSGTLVESGLRMKYPLVRTGRTAGAKTDRGLYILERAISCSGRIRKYGWIVLITRITTLRMKAVFITPKRTPRIRLTGPSETAFASQSKKAPRR